MKKIGLVGGLGWVSTLEYYRLINALVNDKLAGHYSAHVLIESLNEGAFLDNQKQDASGELCKQMILDAVAVLVAGGAEVIALCANGLHRFMPSIKAHYNIKIVDIRTVTARFIEPLGLNKVGLIGVQKTMDTDFYKSVLREHSIEPITPSNKSKEFIHNAIISELVLNQFNEDTKIKFLKVIDELKMLGAEAVILGCTEIPLLLKSSDHNGIALLSTTDIHCDMIVAAALE